MYEVFCSVRWVAFLVYNAFMCFFFNILPVFCVSVFFLKAQDDLASKNQRIDEVRVCVYMFFLD